MTQPSSATAQYPLPGEVLEGKYQIEKMLGEGGMGAVAKATHLLRRAPVALKFMNPMYLAVPGAVERFHNEAVAASQIESEHVVQIFDVGSLPSGAPYMVMEFMLGIDLSDLLARDGRPGLPVDRAIHFLLQILRGLQAAHAKGIIHRDMKPSNCFVVEKDGEPDFVKLLDFGISKVKQPGGASLTQTNSALGTPLYMSPEQAKSPRDVDGRTDIYSVGVILYELLTGRTPFFSESGEFTEILFKLFTSEAPPIKSLRPDLPEGLAAAVHHALSREPQNRFPDAASFAEALAPYAGPHSQQILHRIRNFGVPSAYRRPMGSVPSDQKVSLRPPPQSNLPPGIADTGAKGHEVLDATMGAAGGAVGANTGAGGMTGDVMIPRPAPVPGASTDLGATRDTGEASRAGTKKGGAAVFVAVGGLALLLGIGGTVFAISRHDGGATRPDPTVKLDPTTSVTSPPPPPTEPLPSAAPSAPPTAQASAPPSATLAAVPDAGAPKKPPQQPNIPGPTLRRNPDGKPCGPGFNPCVTM